MDRMSAFIEPGSCWRRIVGEDRGDGACDLCVQICPAVFEKPTRGRCARVRVHADLAGHAEQVLRAVQGCPVDAIRVTTVEAREIRGQSYKWVPVVDEEHCTGCGLCVEACGPCCLEIVDDIAIPVRPDKTIGMSASGRLPAWRSSDEQIGIGVPRAMEQGRMDGDCHFWERRSARGRDLGRAHAGPEP